MKTKIISAISILLAFPMFAQVTYESNDPNFGSPLGYIGWDAAANLDFRTNDVVRMTLIPLLVAGFKEQQGVISEQAATIAEQNAIIENLQGQMNQQAQEISELQVQMAQFAASFQQAKSDMNNCCGLKNHATGHVPATDKGVILEQNRPNPFANQTTISFALPEDATVRLEISDASGRVLEVLLQTRLDAGTHHINWDASRHPAGV